MNRAAVSYVERGDGRILCVWNSRYGGWTLPGGKVEEGETVEAAQERELYEETGLRTARAAPIYTAETCVKDAPSDRGRLVYVFRVETTDSWFKQMEPDHPVAWFTREQFLKWSPFAEFYTEMFNVLERDRVPRKTANDTIRNAATLLKQAAASLELEGGRPDSDTLDFEQGIAEAEDLVDEETERLAARIRERPRTEIDVTLDAAIAILDHRPVPDDAHRILAARTTRPKRRGHKKA